MTDRYRRSGDRTTLPGGVQRHMQTPAWFCCGWTPALLPQECGASLPRSESRVACDAVQPSPVRCCSVRPGCWNATFFHQIAVEQTDDSQQLLDRCVRQGRLASLQSSEIQSHVRPRRGDGRNAGQLQERNIPLQCPPVRLAINCPKRLDVDEVLMKSKLVSKVLVVSAPNLE